MTEPLQDARGCLTAGGLRVLRESAPGRAPAGIAQHLAGCPRCQGRLLASGRPEDQDVAQRVRTLRTLGYLILGGSLLAGAGLAVVTLLRR